MLRLLTLAFFSCCKNIKQDLLRAQISEERISICVFSVSLLLKKRLGLVFTD